MQDYNKEKLIQQVVNMDNMTVEAASAFHNAHTVFCALGTTRKVPQDSLGFQFCQSTMSKWQHRINLSAMTYRLPFLLTTAGGASAVPSAPLRFLRIKAVHSCSVT